MSKHTAKKQPRAGGQFCKVPDGYISPDAQSKALGELHIWYIKESHLKYHEGHKDGFNVGQDKGYNEGQEKGAERGVWIGVVFGVVGLLVLEAIAVFGNSL